VVAAFLDAANDANLEGVLGGVICVDRAGEALDEAAGGDGLGVVRAREASRDNGGVTPAASGFCAPLAKDASEVGFVCDLLASDNRWRAERGTDGVVSSFGVSEVPR
jgi:pyruvoyl-dependent arginine decarboxylase (PvlArgDC)